MDTVCFGLVGYGAWGRCHAQAIQETPGCKLQAISASTKDTLRRAATETQAAIHSDFRELVIRRDIDIVDVVVPNYLHEEVACAALESGKHVLLEKPMSITIDYCDRIIEAARRAQRFVLVGHEMRFANMYVQIREMIRSGEIGDPRYILVDLWRRPYRSGSQAWRSDPKRVGNWILEEPVHFFDVVTWFLDGVGEPSTVCARGNLTDAGRSFQVEVCDNFSALVGYSNGAYAVITATMGAVGHHVGIRIFGSEAMIRAEWHAKLDRSEDPNYFLEISRGNALQRLPIIDTPGELFELREEILTFAHTVRNGGPLPISPEEGRTAVMLCLQSQRSIETGAVIKLT